MSATFGTVDFGFRPIRPEEDYSGMECGEEDPPHGSSLAHPHASGATFRVAEDEADDLFISDTETLPDSTGFGARQRLINEQQRVAAAAAERAAPGPFLGSTLTELCESYGAIAAASSTPCDVWAEVITTLREREAAKRAWVLDPKTARHMKYRTTLIEWVLEVCADFGFGPTTADLAVQYMVRREAAKKTRNRARASPASAPRDPRAAPLRSRTRALAPEPHALTEPPPSTLAGSRLEQGERPEDLPSARRHVLPGSCRYVPGVSDRSTPAGLLLRGRAIASVATRSRAPRPLAAIAPPRAPRSRRRDRAPVAEEREARSRPPASPPPTIDRRSISASPCGRIFVGDRAAAEKINARLTASPVSDPIRSRPPLLRPPLAVKYEEIEADVPSLPKLRRCASNVYSVEIIKKMELAVLIELDWDLASVATAHFLEAVLALTGGGTFPHDDVGDRQWTTACAAQLRKLAGYLHSICLQDAQISAKVPASQLAAAIVATARVQLNIYPVWPAELRVATGYACDALGPAMSDILRLYKDALPPPGPTAGTDEALETDPFVVDEEEARWDDDDGAYGEEEEEGAPRDATVGNGASKGSREFLTPSPTGPLDAGDFFDDMETSEGAAMVTESEPMCAAAC